MAGFLLYLIMDRIERIDYIDELEKYVSFHEDKANYYNEIMIKEQLKLSTIGFVTSENVTKDRICYTAINADKTTIENEW